MNVYLLIVPDLLLTDRSIRGGGVKSTKYMYVLLTKLIEFHYRTVAACERCSVFQQECDNLEDRHCHCVPLF